MKYFIEHWKGSSEMTFVEMSAYVKGYTNVNRKVYLNDGYSEFLQATLS